MRTALLTTHSELEHVISSTSPSRFTQFIASALRCGLLKTRKPISCAVEIILPIAFVGLLAWLSTLSKSADHSGSIIVEDEDSQLPEMDDFLQMATCMSSSALPAHANNQTRHRDAILQKYVPPCHAVAANASQSAGVQCGGQFSTKWLSPRLCLVQNGMLGMLGFINDMEHLTLMPSVDAMIIAHIAFADFLGPIESGLMRPNVMNALRSLGKVHFAPDTAETDALITQLRSIAPTHGMLFLTEEGGFLGGKHSTEQGALDSFANGTDDVWALLSVSKFNRSSAELAVTISMNKTTVPWTNKVRSRFRSLGAGSDFKVYWASGFLSLEQAVLDAFNPARPDRFDHAGNKAGIAPMPYVAYQQHVFLDIAGELVPLALALSFLAGVSQVSERLVQEKELRLREAMASMGVCKTALFLAWLSIFFIINALSAAGTTLALHTTFMSKTDSLLLFAVFLCYGMSATALGSLLSSLFSRSRTAAIATPILFFACAIPSFALDSNSYLQTVRALAVLSPTAFSSALRTILDYERHRGMAWDDLWDVNDSIPLGESLIMLIGDTMVYAVLAWYLENVLGGEWGVRQHPCFCMTACVDNTPAPPDVHILDRDAEADGSSPYTSSGAAEKYPEGQQEVVQIDRVSKEFGAAGDVTVAVRGVSLKVFPAMVTAILGHNGAGKTTLCNMLTGMLPMTSGDCMVCGSSITRDSRAARQHIGMCPQHNVLWGDLTPFEHLHYFARVKGVSFSQCGAVADAMLAAVDLTEKRDARACTLSGGQKRKLSVGIAFIGGSELVLLDEPTAGMDVQARRHTWELIKRMAREEGRAVVLTTHYMDEAELLGDRVGIMAGGELHSYGSSTFLKTALSQAYSLTLQYTTPPSDHMRESMIRIVQGEGGVGGATEKEARGREQVLALPIEEVAAFGGMLRVLELRREELQLSSLSVSAATIEDVFLAIAHQHMSPSGFSSGIDRSNNQESRNYHDRNEPGEERSTTTLTVEENLDGTKLHRAAACRPTWTRQLASLLLKRFHVVKRDRRALLMQIFLPLLSLLLAMSLANSGPPATPSVEISPLSLPDSQQVVLGNCSQAFTDAIAREVSVITANASSTFETAQYLQNTYLRHGGIERAAAVTCLDNTQHAVFSTSPTTVLFSNSTAFRHAAPFSLLLWYQARVGESVGRTTSMQVWSHPLPFRQAEQAELDAGTNAIMALLIVVSFSFQPSTFTSFVVRERTSRAKLLQLLSGAGFAVYWASNLLFDLASSLLTSALAMVIFAVFNRSEYVGSAEAVVVTGLLLALYALAAIPTSYVLALPFDNHSTAQNAVLAIFFAGGFGLTLAGYLIRALDGPTWLLFLFRLLPSQCLGEGLIAIANAPTNQRLGQAVDLWAMDQTGWALLYLGLEAVAMAAVVLFVDHPERSRRQQMLSYQSYQHAPLPPDEAPSVVSEREMTDAADSNSDEAILTVRGLRKEYYAPPGSGRTAVVAVQNVSFKVGKGEIFGLLGTNGAGKTTTMQVITGECLPTMGSATVCGFNVVTSAGQAREHMGYCPQFDALHDLMTVDEHLSLYCALRGVQGVQQVTAKLTTALGLEDYRRVTAAALSGGNKRKLSVAIALVGSPRLLLLDEPTAGMDPVARRRVCEVLTEATEHCAVLLTTHHLEEVESMADRAAVMVDGRMRCVGSLPELKATLGEGYQVSVCVGEEERVGAVVARLQAAYVEGQCRLVERHHSRLRFAIKPQQSRPLQLSTLFDLLLAIQADAALTVREYSVSQSSVEQVFLAVAAGADAGVDAGSASDDGLE